MPFIPTGSLHHHSATTLSFYAPRHLPFLHNLFFVNAACSLSIFDSDSFVHLATFSIHGLAINDQPVTATMSLSTSSMAIRASTPCSRRAVQAEPPRLCGAPHLPFPCKLIFVDATEWGKDNRVVKKLPMVNHLHYWSIVDFVRNKITTNLHRFFHGQQLKNNEEISRDACSDPDRPRNLVGYFPEAALGHAKPPSASTCERFLFSITRHKWITITCDHRILQLDPGRHNKSKKGQGRCGVAVRGERTL
ncbi:p21-activated protein kinase-interacting protein isoform X2 [Spatholobus suberectus]|nr:p21-activated protein kinase-interacting protein isoform X2 [Spatholobus suberectus]